MSYKLDNFKGIIFNKKNNSHEIFLSGTFLGKGNQLYNNLNNNFIILTTKLHNNSIIGITQNNLFNNIKCDSISKKITFCNKRNKIYKSNNNKYQQINSINNNYLFENNFITYNNNNYNIFTLYLDIFIKKLQYCKFLPQELINFNLNLDFLNKWPHIYYKRYKCKPPQVYPLDYPNLKIYNTNKISNNFDISLIENNKTLNVIINNNFIPPANNYNSYYVTFTDCFYKFTFNFNYIYNNTINKISYLNPTMSQLLINNIQSYLTFSKSMIYLYGNFLGKNSNIYKNDPNKIILTQRVNCSSSIIGLTQYNLANNISNDISNNRILFHKKNNNKSILINNPTPNIFPKFIDAYKEFSKLPSAKYLFDNNIKINNQHYNLNTLSSFNLYYNVGIVKYYHKESLKNTFITTNINLNKLLNFNNSNPSTINESINNFNSQTIFGNINNNNNNNNNNLISNGLQSQLENIGLQIPSYLEPPWLGPPDQLGTSLVFNLLTPPAVPFDMHSNYKLSIKNFKPLSQNKSYYSIFTIGTESLKQYTVNFDYIYYNGLTNYYYNPNMDQLLNNNINSKLVFSKDKLYLHGNFLGPNSNIYKTDHNNIILKQQVNASASVIGITQHNLKYNISQNFNKKTIIFHKKATPKNIRIKNTNNFNNSNKFIPVKDISNLPYLFDLSFTYLNNSYTKHFTLYYNYGLFNITHCESLINTNLIGTLNLNSLFSFNTQLSNFDISYIINRSTNNPTLITNINNNQLNIDLMNPYKPVTPNLPYYIILNKINDSSTNLYLKIDHLYYNSISKYYLLNQKYSEQLINNVKSYIQISKDKIYLYGNFLGSNSNIYKDDPNKIILTQQTSCSSSVIGLTQNNLSHNISINKKNIIFHKSKPKKNISINYFPKNFTKSLTYINNSNYLFESSGIRYLTQDYSNNFTMYYNYGITKTETTNLFPIDILVNLQGFLDFSTNFNNFSNLYINYGLIDTNFIDATHNVNELSIVPNIKFTIKNNFKFAENNSSYQIIITNLLTMKSNVLDINLLNYYSNKNIYLLYPYIEDFLIKNINIDIYQLRDASINLSNYFYPEFKNLTSLTYDLLPISNINNTYNLHYNNRVYNYEIIDITNNINNLESNSNLINKYLNNVINDDVQINYSNDRYPSYYYSNNNDLIINTKSLIRYFAGSISQSYIIYTYGYDLLFQSNIFTITYNILCNPNLCPLPALPNRISKISENGSTNAMRMQFSQNIRNAHHKKAKKIKFITKK